MALVKIVTDSSVFLPDPDLITALGIEVHSGDVIGLLNDQLTAKGPDSAAVVKTLLEQMDAANREIITLYYGQPVTAQEADALLAELSGLFPGQEIEIVSGGQPFYHYIISAE